MCGRGWAVVPILQVPGSSDFDFLQDFFAEWLSQARFPITITTRSADASPITLSLVCLYLSTLSLLHHLRAIYSLLNVNQKCAEDHR